MKLRHKVNFLLFSICFLPVQSAGEQVRLSQEMSKQSRQIRIALSVQGKDLSLQRDIETFFSRGLLDFNEMEHSDRLLTKNDADLSVQIIFAPIKDDINSKIAFAYRAMLHDADGSVNPGWGRSGWVVWEGMLISKTDSLEEVKLIAEIILATRFNNDVVDKFRQVLQGKSKK